MAKNRTMNMSQGRPLALLAAFALPLLVGNLFQQAYNLADSIIVGQFIGANALAAVGATGSISFLFFSVCNGISSGGGIVTAQFFGAGDAEKVKRAIANSAYIMFSASLFMGAVAFALTPTALRLLGTPEDILPDAITYMRMTCLSVPLIGVYNYSASMLRALGGPFAGIRFCPTGGVDAANFAQYLALPNVFAVGGSWLAPEDAVRARDWRRITGLAAKASGELTAFRQSDSA